MSWLLTPLAEHTGVMLTQVTNFQPEAPPGSQNLEKLVRYLVWFVLLSGVSALIFAGGKFAWEKWQAGMIESPKMIVGALIGGIVATSAGSIMNAVLPQ